jgi:hypothetical protein
MFLAQVSCQTQQGMPDSLRFQIDQPCAGGHLVHVGARGLRDYQVDTETSFHKALGEVYHHPLGAAAPE